jgi:hypothetical protein
MMARSLRISLHACLLALVLAAPAHGAAPACDGAPQSGIPGWEPGWKLSDGGFAGFAKMNVNIDGYGRAYHPNNADAGALIHLCNAGRVYLADGTVYEGSESNATCTGRFMSDVARIAAAGWTDPAAGAVQWYGVLGEGSVKIQGRLVSAVKPVVQSDGSGFYVSPTSLFDRSVADSRDQSRYVNPLRVPSAVVPRALVANGIAFGTFGVAYNGAKRIAVPFVVGDGGPRVGEGSVALARLAAGLPLTDSVTRRNRFDGQVGTKDVLWVFFGGAPAAFDSRNEARTSEAARAAFETWGGEPRLAKCLETVPTK